MKVSEAGEFGLIRQLARTLGIVYPPVKGQAHGGLRVGLGDDAAVGQRREGALIWTTDTMVAGVHFLAATSWRNVGWKALAVNLSDIAAMGGRPDLALLTLMLPPDFCVEEALEVYTGIKEAADTFEVTVAGGDIVRSPVFAITVAQSGWAHTSRLGEPQVMTRDAARKGDIVAVSGTLGDSAAGLLLLKGGDDCSRGGRPALRLAHERPQPQVALGQAAVRAGVRCAIDISDGLVQDLGHVATASNVTIRIDAERVPTSEALREAFPERALSLALSGGEDYELLLVAPRPVLDVLGRVAGVPLCEVGEVVGDDEARVAVVDDAGRELPLGSRGWDHLAGR
jgi:thiamine-monophosphate kinase